MALDNIFDFYEKVEERMLPILSKGTDIMRSFNDKTGKIINKDMTENYAGHTFDKITNKLYATYYKRDRYK